MELNPLLKWTGGKRSELPILKPLFPTHTRVIEPFAGGAAVSWHSNPGSVILNDVSKDLILFYETIKNNSDRKNFIASLKIIDEVRKDIHEAVDTLKSSDVTQIFDAKTEKTQKKIVDRWISQPWYQKLPSALQTACQIDTEKSLKNKLYVRIPSLESKRGKKFTTDSRKEHLETALQAGLYTTLRRVYNKEQKISGLPDGWNVASWFVVRTLCYSGMFRYSASGAFNVPYGGIGYNARDFEPNIKQFSQKSVLDFLANTQLHRKDFEDLFKTYQFFDPQHDFIFVDPPYDSEFSQYNADNDFTHEDQKRLAKTLLATKAPWMLVIKNTPFILSLYTDKSLHCAVFNKVYQVNFRNRHDRGVEHLIVTNYPLPLSENIQPISAKNYFAQNKKHK